MAEQAGIRWTIRGVPLELREAAEKAAGSKHRLGDWVADAIRRALEAPETSFAAEGRADYRAELDAISERLAAVERALAAPGRATPTMTPPKAVPMAIEGKSATRSKAEPKAADAVTGRNQEWFKPPRYKRLNEAGIAEIRRRYEAGEGDEDIAKVIGYTVAGINKYTSKFRRNSKR